jgi:hypothetical protein
LTVILKFGRRRASQGQDLIDTAPGLRTEADILRKTPRFKWTKDRGKELERAKEDGPRFWSDNTFTRDRVIDAH